MNIKFNIGNRIIFFELAFRKKRNSELIQGYTNRCADGRYIVFLDYDNVELGWIIGECQRLQSEYCLSDFYILKSSENSYHAICLDKIPLFEYVTILKNSSVDPNYMNVPLHFGKKVWTLRMDEKGKKNLPEFVFWIMSKNQNNEKSRPHAQFLNALFDTKIKIDDSFDGEKKILFSMYRI